MTLTCILALPSIWYIAHALQSDPINSDLCFRFPAFLVPRLSLRYSLSSLSCRVKKIIILRSFAKLSLVFILPSLFPPTVPCIWISCFHCFACTPTLRYLLSYHSFFLSFLCVIIRLYVSLFIYLFLETLLFEINLFSIDLHFFLLFFHILNFSLQTTGQKTTFP